jgi:N-acetylglucosamine-6-phosphate deacetylase
METSATFSDTWEADVNRARLLAIDAASVFTPIRQFSPGRVLIDGASIAEVGSPESIPLPGGAEQVIASHLLVTPGFIDPHIHGCGGVDVMDGTYESLNTVSRIVARHGTTSFLPTTVSSPPEVLGTAVEKLGALMSMSAGSFDGARPIGIHLEGPFISAAQRGAHKASNVLAPDPALFKKWMQASGNSVRLVTIAPELAGADALIAMAKDLGVTVAMGHSNATLDEASAAAACGVCYAVHTFNAMRGFSHRDPGIVGEVLAHDRIFAEIIADGIHVDRAVIRTFARAKGKARVLLVTDAISAADMPDGRYGLGSETVAVMNGICRDSEGRLAGSTLTQEIALRNFIDWTDWAFDEALLGLTLNPARALKLETKGVLEPGADADLVMMDTSFRIMKTFVAGRLVFERSGFAQRDGKGTQEAQTGTQKAQKQTPGD